MKKKVSFFSLLCNALLMIGGVIMLFPFLLAILGSFKPSQDVANFPFGFLTKNFTFENYTVIFSKLDFLRVTCNTIFLTTVRTGSVLYTSALCGYVFSKMHFRGRDRIFLCLLVTMLIPGTVMLVPRYQMMMWFGWLDSYTAIIMPGLFQTFGIFMMRQFLMGIPDYFVDAARIDGASEMYIFHRLIMPMLTGGLFSLGVLQVMDNWNEFLWPFLVLNSKNLYTLPIALRSFSNSYWNDYSWMLAGVCISMIPLMLIYLFGQDKIIDGLAHSGATGM